MRILLLVVGILPTFLCCSHDRSKKSTKKITYFEPFQLGAFNKQINARITARFNECGEWGGHTEEIILTADQTENFFAEYKVFPINCDSIFSHTYINNIVPAMSKKIILDETRKQLIIQYLHNLADGVIMQDLPSHAATRFTFSNSDSSLWIDLSTDKAMDIVNYKTFVEKLF